ncbi:MAG: type II toxin-antitoxin system VapC family toxin [Ferrovibrio sp.]
MTLPAKLRVMFDSNAYDEILRHNDADRIRALIEAGELAVVTTHVQEDELRQITDAEKQKRLLSAFYKLRTQNSPTSVALWGVSKWGQSNWTSPQQEADLNAIKRNRPVASRDEIIGTTAKDYCDVFVTEDKKFAARLAEAAPKLRLVNYDTFRREVLK